MQISTSDATQIGFNSQILNNNMAVLWSTISPGTAGKFRVERATGSVFSDGSFNCGLASNCFNTGMGADIAEHIDVSESVEPGDVVELDLYNPKHYRKARTPSSSLVAGVISTNPGLFMGHRLGRLQVTQALPRREKQRDELMLSVRLAQLGQGTMLLSGVSVALLVPYMDGKDTRPLLALIGRVPVKATTENGPIRVGDLLTSSFKPGYAMRCDSPQKCEGAIIGKALESLDEGEGVIMMLVMR